MAAPTIYRSTDTNAPILTVSTGSMRQLLQSCLVDGYGSTRATGTITIGANVSAGDTITIDGTVYTFVSPVGSTPGNVLIGASAAASLSNLAAAMCGYGGAVYVVGGTGGTGQTYQSRLQVTNLTATAITVTALAGGTGGNLLAMTTTAANLTLSGATLSGGSGSNTTASLGWTMPYTSVRGFGAAFKQPAGCGFYCVIVDDGVITTSLVREAAIFGNETMSAWATGTGAFPNNTFSATSANFSGYGGTSVGACGIRKCGGTADSSAKPWMLIGDDRTFYGFVQTGDVASTYVGFGFGDFYSTVVGDAYKCAVYGYGFSASAVSISTHPFGYTGNGLAGQFGGVPIPRNYTGLGGFTLAVKVCDTSMASNTSIVSAANLSGSVGFPNAEDGGLYAAVIRLFDCSTAILVPPLAGTINMRGTMRGFFHQCHAIANFADGDTIAGTGAYAGRNFLFVKTLMGNTTSAGLLETTAWPTSA